MKVAAHAHEQGISSDQVGCALGKVADDHAVVEGAGRLLLQVAQQRVTELPELHELNACGHAEHHAEDDGGAHRDHGAAEACETGDNEHPEKVNALALRRKQPEGKQDGECQRPDSHASHRVVVNAFCAAHGEDAREPAEQESDRHLQRLKRVVGDRIAGVRHVKSGEGGQDSEQGSDRNRQAAVEKRSYQHAS